MRLFGNGRIRTAAAAAVVLASVLAYSTSGTAVGPNPNETIDTTMTAIALAQSLVGPGVAISNVQYTGAPDSRGRFSFTDATVVGMASGVILSSGNAHDVVGPNTTDSVSTDWTNPGDADLDALSGFSTFDATVLEFDFTPTANQVSFQYAFSSDEYSEWVQTPYNDVFAFFVNGTNCAVVRQVAGDPGAPWVPVAVNNINNSNPVIDPPPAPMRPDLFRANDYNPAGPSAIDLEMDGVTRVLTCQAAVVPGAVNHMKLAIADASDGIYDSTVFIEAGSLVSDKKPTADLGVLPSSGQAPLLVTATVEGHDPDGAALDYSVDWGDGSAADSGPLPGETALITHRYSLPGDYMIVLTISNGSLSGQDSEDIKVLPGAGVAPSITANPSNQTVAAGQPFSFSASASGTPTPDVQWQTSSGGGGAFIDIPGATVPTYGGTATTADNGHKFRAVFTNTAGSATSTAATLTVTSTEAIVSLASNPSPSSVGQAVTFTATLAGVPAPIAGTMSFFDGASLLGTKTVTGTVTSLQTTKLITAGTHSITAAFDRGSGTVLTSPALPHMVLASATALTVSSSKNPSVFTQKITLKATVKRLSPAQGTVVAGTVTFYDAGIAITPAVPINSGVAKVTTTALSVGDHAMTATYNGSPDDGASVSVAVLQHVDQAATSVTITSSLNPSTLGQPVTLKATVKRMSPAKGAGTGTVDFYDGATAIALGVTLSPKGIASITTSTLTTGDHTIEARYAGSTTDRASHAAMIQHVN